MPGDERDALVLDHLGRAAGLARRWRHAVPIPPEDLIQEAHLGLVMAADAFSPARDVTFWTFAAHVIRTRLRVAVAEWGLVRVPSSSRQKFGADEPRVAAA